MSEEKKKNGQPARGNGRPARKSPKIANNAQSIPDGYRQQPKGQIKLAAKANFAEASSFVPDGKNNRTIESSLIGSVSVLLLMFALSKVVILEAKSVYEMLLPNPSFPAQHQTNSP